MDTWNRVRLVFGKRERLRFLGQLDLGRTLERALRRSGLGVRFSEGFNPRVRMSFPCATPTAMASRCEIVEIQVRSPEGAAAVAERLGGALPADLPLAGAEEVPEGERLRLRAAAYAVRAREDGADLPGEEEARALLGRETIAVERRGRAVDLRPFLLDLRREGEVLRVDLAFREDGATARPEDVLGALGRDPRAYVHERVGMRVSLARNGAPPVERAYGA